MSSRRNIQTVEIEVLRLKIAELLLAGHSERAIAEAVGKSCSTVNYHVQVLLRRWRKAQANSVQRWVGRALAQLDLIEAEAWEAWAKSRIDPKRVVTIRARGVGRRSRKNRPIRIDGELVDIFRRVELIESAGDAQFLQIVISCVERRSRLLGLHGAIEAQTPRAEPEVGSYHEVREKLVQAVERRRAVK